MKRVLTLFILIGVFTMIVACGKEKEVEHDDKLDEVKTRFEAIILENNESVLAVKPVEGEMELRSADNIHVSIGDAVLLDESGKETSVEKFKESMHVEIEYNGMIAESYPAQIHTCYEVKMLP